ncbi:unnamed protein product [Meganyctiphanes norvegica]|uniref:Uncharacterized protein n=1 Tax=Meganyctiphanes norvegica TaxID=48144 RepID=A0AAV2R174_MEGNR
MHSTVDCYVFPDPNFSFTSLKELCAQTFLHLIEKDRSPKKFAHIPPKLHFYLVEVSLLNLFGDDYNANSQKINLPYSLIQLLHHWPLENFVLSQLMPYLPPRYRDVRIKMQDGLLRSDNRILGSISWYLHRFYGLLADAIFEYILTNDVRYNIIGVAKKVDLTRRSYYVMYCSKISPKKVFKILKRRATINSVRRRWQSFQNRIMKNTTNFENANEKKLEVYVGLSLWLEEYIPSMKQILEMNISEPGVDISIYYKKIEMTCSPLALDEWIDFTQVLFDNRTNYHQFAYGNPQEASTLYTMCSRLPDLQSIRVAGISLPSIKCFLSLQHLTDLNLEDINLNGQLDNLYNLKTGLIALRLEDCSLDNEDLDILSSSHHTASMQEVNLSNNRFTDPCKDSDTSPNGGLIGLVEKLAEVRMLNLHLLGLNLWSDSSLQLLVNSFRDRPKLTILNLQLSNIFSERIMITIISQLAESDSLKIIELDLPFDVPRDQLKGFQQRFLRSLHEVSHRDDLQVVSGHYHLSVVGNLDTSLI